MRMLGLAMSACVRGASESDGMTSADDTGPTDPGPGDTAPTDTGPWCGGFVQTEVGSTTSTMKFRSITVTGSDTCGIDRDGAVWCWDQEAASFEPPCGRFNEANAGGTENLGITEGGAVVLWAHYHEPEVSDAWTSASSVSSGGLVWCAVLTTDGGGVVACKTAHANGPLSYAYASDRYLWYHVGAGYWDWGLTTDGRILALERYEGTIIEVDGGSETWVDLGDGYDYLHTVDPGAIQCRVNCGLAETGEVHCWDLDGNSSVDDDIPHGTFVDVDVGGSLGIGFAVAVDDDGALHVWGDLPNDELADPPDGSFAGVDCGGGESCCALDVDGYVSCWGHPSLNIYPP